MRWAGAEPRGPRLVEPDLRSRVVGYLAHSADVPDGRRTDGEWTWPRSLADDVRATGVGPGRGLLDHMAARDFAPVPVVPADVVAAAARAAATAPIGPVATERWSVPSDAPVAWRGAEVALAPYGWGPGELAAATGGAVEEVPADDAVRLVDRACARWHDRLLREAAESAAVLGQPRFARVFDGASPAGRPWFSPARRRIPPSSRRDRIAAYLAGGRLAVRVTGRAADPLDPDRGAVVALNLRTDGVWVWQEALVHYVQTYGVAPELALLCHIEERGGPSPAEVPTEAVHAAAAVAAAPPPPLGRAPVTYHMGDAPDGPLVRAVGDDAARAEALGADLAWRPSDALWRHRRGEGPSLAQISVAAAIRIIDHRCSRSVGRV
jgi:hypothetical protein